MPTPELQLDNALTEKLRSLDYKNDPGNGYTKSLALAA
jgi:hypothetical protein